jgi:hypothetical protein
MAQLMMFIYVFAIMWTQVFIDSLSDCANFTLKLCSILRFEFRIVTCHQTLNFKVELFAVIITLNPPLQSLKYKAFCNQQRLY